MHTVRGALILVCGSMATWATPPINDNFSNATTIAATNYVVVTGNNEQATKESGEPNHNTGDATSPGTNPGGKSVWWRWTAPASGSYLVSTHGSEFDTMLGVYTGTSVDTLTKIAANDNGLTPYNTNVVVDLLAFEATADTTYLIAVDGKLTGTNVARGNVRLTIVPNNDLFENRVALGGSNVTWLAFNGQASKEASERNHATGSTTGNPGGKSLWWQWKAPATGSYLVCTYPATFDGALSVYRSTGPAINNVVKLASDTNNWAGYLNFSVRANLVTFTVTDTNYTYLIAVDGIRFVSNGSTNVSSGALTLSLLPDNDHLAAAHPLAGETARGRSFNGVATAETGELNVSTYVPGRSVWWKWSPPKNGSYTLTTADSQFDTFMVVYTNLYNPPTIAGLRSAQYEFFDDNGGSYFDPSSAIALQSAYSNVTYYIKVDGHYEPLIEENDYGAIFLDIFPDNDRFTNRVALVGTNLTTQSANSQAGSDSATEFNILRSLSLSYGFEYNTKSIWWSWTAPTNGTVAIDTIGSGLATVLAVYTGTNASFSDLSLVAWNVNTPDSGFASKLDFTVVPGTDYKIQVVGASSIEYGKVILNLKFQPAPAPPGDFFAGPIVLSGTAAASTVTNTFATKEAGEPKHAGVTGGRSIWWRWTPANSGQAVVSTAGSLSQEGGPLDTVLAIYTGGALASLTQVVANNDEEVNTPTSRTNFSAVAGQTYYIAVDCMTNFGGMVDLGVVQMSLTQIVPPPNDNFAQRITLTGLPTSTNFNNVNGTKETGEPNHAQDFGGASVWWSWRAPASGRATISTEGSGFNTVLAVYQGTAVGALNLVAENDDSIPGMNFSRVDLDVVSNQVYQIAVDGVSGETGAGVLKILPPIAISSFAKNPDDSFTVRFPTSFGRSYVVLFSTTLQSASWFPITIIDGTGDQAEFTDNEAFIDRWRFYRVEEW